MINKTNGYSLLETLIGMTVGVLVLTTMSSMFIPGMATYRQVNAVSEIQEMSRTAYSVLPHQLPQIGHVGCNSSPTTRLDSMVNVVNLPHNDTVYLVDEAMHWSPFNHRVPVLVFPPSRDLSELLGTSRQRNRTVDHDGATVIGDVLFTLGAKGASLTVIEHRHQEQDLTLLGNHYDTLKKGAFLALNDCHHASLLHVINPRYDDTSDTTTVGYANTDLDGDGDNDTFNCSAVDQYGNDTGLVLLGGDADAHCATSVAKSFYQPYVFHRGSDAVIMESRFYYLAYPRSRTDDTSSLYSVSMNNEGLPGTSVELIAGVENFRVLYGVRSSSTNSVTYVGSSVFTGNTDVDGDGVAETWNDIVALGMYLLLRSQSGEGEKGNQQIQKIKFPDLRGNWVDCDDTATDRNACPEFLNADFASSSRYRRVFQYTVPLPNKF